MNSRLAKKHTAVIGIALAPLISFAAAPGDFREFVLLIIGWLQSIILIIQILAVLYFIWGLAKFILRLDGDEKAVTEGRQMMLWGLIGLFVLVTVWAIVGLVSGEFGFITTDVTAIPFLKTQ